MQRDRLVLRAPREKRREAVRLSTGSNYSDEGSRQPQPINLLSLYESTMARSLVPKAPRAMLSTFKRDYKPIVSAMQDWANPEIEHVRLESTLRRIVVDALYCAGFCKVALASPADSATTAWNQRAGLPFAERVDLDDMVWDTHARAFEEVGFIGHRFRCPLDVAKKMYGRGAKDLEAQTDAVFNMEGDERISMIGRTYYASDDTEFRDMVDLWEVYIPHDRLIYTFRDEQLSGAGGGGGKFLKVQRWIGPDTGPYHILGYKIVSGNIMPKGPIQDLVDLHVFINETYRKIMRQTQRMKAITGVRNNTEDGARLQALNDGDIGQFDNPEQIFPFEHGGPSQKLVGIFIDAIQRFSYVAGGLDLIAGLGHNAPTLGQDQMLQANASATVNDMQTVTTNYAGDIIKSLCWYWHHDPFRVMNSVHQVAGAPDVQIARSVHPQQRQQIPWEELQVKVDPYSMQTQTPQQRKQELDQLVTQILIPMMPILAQNGITFDPNAYLQKRSVYSDMPDLPDLVTIQEPPQQGGGGGPPEAAAKPAQTERTYNRISTPTRTQRGDDMNKVNQMMGINPGGGPETAKNGVAQ